MSEETYAPLDDTELMLRVQANDTHAFAALYDRFAERVFRIASRFLRDETRAGHVVEETFVSLWTQRADYVPTLGPVNVWVAGTMRDRLRDHHRPKGA